MTDDNTTDIAERARALLADDELFETIADALGIEEQSIDRSEGSLYHEYLIVTTAVCDRVAHQEQEQEADNE